MSLQLRDDVKVNVLSANDGIAYKNAVQSGSSFIESDVYTNSVTSATLIPIDYSVLLTTEEAASSVFMSILVKLYDGGMNLINGTVFAIENDYILDDEQIVELYPAGFSFSSSSTTITIVGLSSGNYTVKYKRII